MAVKKDLRLEQRLLLHSWINSLFGYGETRELLQDFRDAEEGFDARGTSGVYRRMTSRSDRVKVPLDSLRRYDDNTRAHLEAVNRLRAEPITLRYFQHLTLLYAEVFLDYRFNRPAELLQSLNDFAERQQDGQVRFSEGDLGKLALWMATGSGKTLLMHVNYHQFLHYNEEPLDNILLITPNEDLTEQHLEDMRLSGIPCERFQPGESGLRIAARDVVRATEITKIKEEKKGQGVSVDVDAFEGRNLIFVDEGHRGTVSKDSDAAKSWRPLRDKLAEKGFTFEYSATFGQAVQASGSEELAREYGKAILFDYSYRHFHGDGFGKDFEVLNLKNQSDEYTDLLLLGNLLSFYEQRRCFEENEKAVEEYNLESPLWIFVGSRVNAVYQQNNQKSSDVLTVVRFLHRFLKNEGGWAVEGIGKLLKGDTGLQETSGRDAFETSFSYLKKSGADPAEVFGGVLEKVFHSRAGGALLVSDIKGVEGELGLKVSGLGEHFGLIYIGDTSAFKKLLEERAPDIPVEEDAIAGSLFERIEEDGSPVNLLIGARKFTEGWSSWRVSAMGLLNIGKSEGSQIIQLFGRGVRLKGKDRSLKRGDALDGSHPAHIGLLETLNIFAVEANYMAQFKEYLEREGVDPEGYEEIPLPIQRNEDFINEGLLIPRVPEGEEFVRNERVLLEVQEGLKVSLDLSVQVETLSMDGGETARARQERRIDSQYLSMLDWDEIYLDLLEHKDRKGFHNLVIQPGTPREIMENPTYRLVADGALFEPESFDRLKRLQEAVRGLLRKYVESSYRVRQQRWDSRHMEATHLSEVHENFADYTVKIKRSREDLISEVEELVSRAEEIYEQDVKKLPSIHFDRYLYQPLLVERDDDIKSTPQALNESETNFVAALRSYCRNGEGALPSGREIFLLRNLSRGKGIGFFNTTGFYPDFILWVKEGDRQRIVFVEPHGMRNDDAPEHNDKIGLHKELQKLSGDIADRQSKELTLDSYIISATPFDELKRRWSDGWTLERFAEEHILFEDGLEEKMHLLIDSP